jgi:putative component of membrane protein insertase Oxa1/YidC/SpoIIIJ protein YidD
MRYLLIALIRLYQHTFPKKWRGKCLYKQSCSHYVLEKTKSHGFLAGIKALEHRRQNCRPGYSLIQTNEGLILITIKNQIIQRDELDKRLIIENHQSE